MGNASALFPASELQVPADGVGVAVFHPLQFEVIEDRLCYNGWFPFVVPHLRGTKNKEKKQKFHFAYLKKKT